MPGLFDSIRIKPTPRLARKLDYAPPIGTTKSQYNLTNPRPTAFAGTSSAPSLSTPTPFRNGKRNPHHAD